jgi:plastocyanin
MEIINSTRLGKYDAFLQRFKQPGHYLYRINHLGEGLEQFQSGPEYEIKVAPSKNKEGIQSPKDAKQFDIQIIYDLKTRIFHAKPSDIEIVAGDFVLWNKISKEGGSYSISGYLDDKMAFNSRQLNSETAYMHMFLIPGEYQYVNGLDNQKEKAAIIRVLPAKMEKAKWLELLSKPNIVNYDRGAFSPPEIEVVPGSTVIWHINGDHPITIINKPIPKRNIPKEIIIKRDPSKSEGFVKKRL